MRTEDTHSCIFKLERNIELIHCIDDPPKTIDDILEDDETPFLLFVLRESVPGVDQSHLLQDG